MKTMDEPVTCSVEQEENSVTLSLFIPDELHWFRGHFPEYPVLPGVVQTHWAIGYGNQYLGLPVRIKKLEAVKFKNVIRPEVTLTLRLSLSPNGKLVFSYHQNTQEMSSGRVVY